MTNIYIELGGKKAIAWSLEWPGWCRSGPDTASALQALSDYAGRYREALARAGIRGPALARSPAVFAVVETLPGDATTDFGAPGAVPAADHRPLTAAELRRQLRLLDACWDAFDAVAAAAHTPLATGPRGGGRELPKIRVHVAEADHGYLGRVGGSRRPAAATVIEMQELRGAFVEALTARARGQVPDRGPRGGLRWPARYAVRRSAWHALDHAWEIEDRSASL